MRFEKDSPVLLRLNHWSRRRNRASDPTTNLSVTRSNLLKLKYYQLIVGLGKGSLTATALPIHFQVSFSRKSLLLLSKNSWLFRLLILGASEIPQNLLIALILLHYRVQLYTGRRIFTLRRAQALS